LNNKKGEGIVLRIEKPEGELPVVEMEKVTFDPGKIE